MEVRNTSEKSEKIKAKSKKLDEDAIICNTLRSDRRRLITKTFLNFSRILKVRIDPNFPQKRFFFFFGFIQREISLSGEKN